MKIFKCKHCGYEWVSRRDIIAPRCRNIKCQSYYWDEEPLDNLLIKDKLASQQPIENKDNQLGTYATQADNNNQPEQKNKPDPINEPSVKLRRPQ